MESSLTATVHGRVREVLVSANAQVPAGKPLLQIDPIEDGTSAAEEEGERLRFEPAELDAGGLERLGWAVLGYDVTADEVARALAAVPAEGDPAEERRLLELYADVRTLDRPHADGLDSGLGSPQEHLYAFLRSLDPEAEGLPERFVAHLGRALAHYGVESLERTGGAGARRLPAVPRAPAGRHDPRGGAGDPGRAAGARRAARRRLPRGARPARGGARPARARARRARARGPLALLRRAGARRRARGDLRGDGRPPGRAGRDGRSRPSARRTSPRWSTARSRWRRCCGRVSGDAGPLVEAMTRRYYRIRPLEGTREALLDGVPFVLSSYERDGRRHHVAATLGEPGRAARGAARARGARPHDPRRRAGARRRLRAARGARRPRRAARRGRAPGRGRARRVRALRAGEAASTCAPTRATATADSPRTRPSAACIR